MEFSKTIFTNKNQNYLELNRQKVISFTKRKVEKKLIY